MDAIEKVLNGLIDSMHKHIAKGHGDKKVNASKEIEKVQEAVEAKEEVKSEPSIFDSFLQKAKDNKAKPSRVEMIMTSSSAPKKKAKK